MELIWTLATVAVVHFLAVASPGPSLVVVVQTAIADSRASGIKNAIGFGFGTLVWALAALFGLELLFTLAPWLYAALKTAGALFLLFLAYRIWVGANSAPFFQTGRPIAAESPANANHYLVGFVTQMANPKVAIFFGSIFATLLPRDPEPALLFFVVVLVFAIETLWYSAMAFAFSADSVKARYISSKSLIDRVSASFLGILGLGLLLDRREPG